MVQVLADLASKESDVADAAEKGESESQSSGSIIILKEAEADRGVVSISKPRQRRTAKGTHSHTPRTFARHSSHTRQHRCGEPAAPCKLACRTRMPQRTRHTCPRSHCCTRHSSGWRKPGTSPIASPLLTLQRRTRGSDARGIESTPDRTHRRRNKCCRTRRMPPCLLRVRSPCIIAATHPHWWRTSRIPKRGRCCNRSIAPRCTFHTCRRLHPRSGNICTWIRCNCRTSRAKRASP